MANQQQNQTQQRNFQLTSNNANLNPVGVVYNITGPIIESFTKELLINNGLTSVNTVISEVTYQQGRPVIALFVSLDINNNEVISNMGDIPEEIRGRMRGYNFQPSEKLSKVLSPLVNGDIELITNSRDNFALVPLDLFRVLGVMLDAHHQKHNIRVLDIDESGKGGRFVFTVVKSERFVDKKGIAHSDPQRERVSALIHGRR